MASASNSKRSLPEEITSPCWAFLCDDDGQIVGDVAEKAVDLNGSNSACSPLGLGESASLMEFLETVQAGGDTLGWETTIRHAGSVKNLLLYGTQTRFGTLVLATPAPHSAHSQVACEVPLANAIHDLKNPISSIVGACEYLTEYSPENLNPEQLQMLTEIERSAKTLLRLSERISQLGIR